MHEHSHRMSLRDRVLSWMLDLAERRVLPALARERREALRSMIDRCNAQLHKRVHHARDAEADGTETKESRNRPDNSQP